MRIEKVVLENINSLAGRFEIDFSHERFAEGLFAITGPSGSGKSTVLDAMCLALYGKTPRIKSVSKTSDEVMNKNASFCSAQVFFWSKGKRYSASFLHKCARGKEPFAQAVREIAAYDENGEGKVIASSITEADHTIKEITGLDYSQFTRSIMLAQFQFAEFLKADTGARADILEQITDMDIYRRISAAVYARSKDEEKTLNDIRIAQGALDVLEPDEEQKRKAELGALDAYIDTLGASQRQFAFCNDTLGDIEKLGREKAAFEQEKAAAAVAHKDKTQRYKQAAADVQEAEKAQQRLAQTLKDVRAIDQSMREADKQIAGIQGDVDAQKKAIIGKMNDAKAVFEKYIPDVTKERMRALFESDEVADVIREKAEADLKKAKEKQDALDGKMRELLGGKTEAQWQQLAGLLDAALPVVRAQRAVVLAEVQRETQRNRIDGLKKEAAAQQERQKQIEEKFEYARLHQKFGEERKKLVDGEPCPLCGATKHPGVDEKQNEAYLAEITAQRDELKKQALETQREIAAAQHSVKTLEKTIEEQQRILTQGNQQMVERGWKLGDIGIDIIDDAAEKTILAEIAGIADTMREYGKLRTNREAAGRDVLNCTARMNDVNADALRVQHAKQTADEAHQRMKERQTALKDAQTVRNGLAEKRTVLFGQKNPDDEEKKAAVHVQNARKAAEQARSDLEKAAQRAAQAETDIARTIKQTQDKQSTLDTEYQKAAADVRAAFDEADENAITQAVQSLGENAAGSADAISNIAGGLLRMMAAKRERKGELKAGLDRNEQNKQQRKDLAKQEKKQAQVFKKWEALNKLIGSAEGDKFSRMAQGITFEVLLAYANQSLRRMSDRYVLVRDERNPSKPLEISVADNYQAGDIRPVSNLSGGESFVVSLALALGLSEMSSSKTRIDSLFIDEGFASLDEEYLELALQTLSTLGNREGKLVGVISHVAALKDRIDTQIEVSRLPGGRSTLAGPGVTVV